MLIHLGFCRKVHGIKGGLVFTLFNRDDSVLMNQSIIYIKAIDSTQDEQEIKIEKISFGNKIITYLDGINSRELSEKIVPFEIYVKRADFPKLNDNEVYINDLIGFKVINFKTKELLGVINQFIETPAHINIEVLLPDESRLVVPYVDNFIKEIDIEDKSIEIIKPEFV